MHLFIVINNKTIVNAVTENLGQSLKTTAYNTILKLKAVSHKALSE